MNESLVSVCQMFLIPATLLFGALGVANSTIIRLLVCFLGAATTGLWFYRIWYWTGLSVMDRKTALGLAGLFALAWIFTWLAQLKRMMTPDYERR
jgi:hypothetical protein